MRQSDAARVNKDLSEITALLFSTANGSVRQVLQEIPLGMMNTSSGVTVAYSFAINVSGNLTITSQSVVVHYIPGCRDLLSGAEGTITFSTLSGGMAETCAYVMQCTPGLFNQTLEFQERLSVTDLSVFSERDEEEEEEKWERTFNTPHVLQGLRRLAAEARRQFAAGETEEGGFAVE
jgi:hypothetical protein